MPLDLATLKTAFALLGLLALLGIPVVWWMSRRSRRRGGISTEMLWDADLMSASGGRRPPASKDAAGEPEARPAEDAPTADAEGEEGAPSDSAEETAKGDGEKDEAGPETVTANERMMEKEAPPEADEDAPEDELFPAFGDSREEEEDAPLLFGDDDWEAEIPGEPGRGAEDAGLDAPPAPPGTPRFGEEGSAAPLPGEGPAPPRDEPADAPSPPLPPEAGDGEPEEAAAPASALEDDVFSLLRRERRERDASPEGGAPRAESEEPEDAGDFAPASGFPPEDDAEREVGKEAAPAASLAPPETPSERVRALVAEACPGDLLLAESVGRTLPDWAPGAADAVRLDLDARRSGRRRPASEEYLRLAILEALLGRAEEATRHLKESLRGASRLGPVLNALAVASWLRGKADPAISYCREALREAGRDAPLQAAIARNLGNFHQRRGDDARAAEFYEMALARAGHDGTPGEIASLRLRAGRLFRRLGEHEKAKTHLSESALLFRRLGNGTGEARARLALASAHTALGEHGPAQANLADALRLCRENRDKAGEARVYDQMGAAYTAQEQLTRALRYYENALGLNRELENAKGAAANLGRMGNIHYARGDFSEAREAYEAALELGREGGDDLARARVLRNLGRTHCEQGEWEAARARLGEARSLFREAGAAEALESVRALERRLPKESGADKRVEG